MIGKFVIILKIWEHLPIIAVLFFLSDGCKITESGSLLNTFSNIWLIWKSCEYDKKELYLYKKCKAIKYGLFQYQCSPPLNGKSIRNEIPAYRSEVRFIQNARKQKYLMDSNLMYADFIKAHAGPNLYNWERFYYINVTEGSVTESLRLKIRWSWISLTCRADVVPLP